MLCLASAAAMTAQNAVTSTDADGFLSRGVRMFDNKNYNGCIDQLTLLRQMNIPESLAEEADYYILLSKLNRNDADCLNAVGRFLSDYPASARRHDVRFAAADHFYHTRDYEKAVTWFSALPEDAFDGSKNAELVFKRSVSLIQCGDYDAAQKGLLRLKSDKTYREPAGYYLAVIDYRNGDYDAAEKGFRNISKRSSLWKEAQFYICQIDFRNAGYSEVRDSGEALLDSGLPEEMQTELLRITGESCYHLGEMDNAAEFLSEYVGKTKTAPERSSLYILGICEFRNAGYENALKHFGEVTAADDEMAQSAYLYAGQAYLRLDNVNAASLAFEKAYRMPYDESIRETAFYNYAIAQSQGGRTPFAGSMKLFQDFLNNFPKSRYASDVEDYIINSYLTGKDYDAALQGIETIKYPSDKILRAKQNLLYRIGARELSNGNTATAIDFLTRADRLAAHDKDIAAENTLWLAEAYYRKGDDEKAKACFRKYLDSGRKTANFAKANYGLGYTCYRMRDYDNALKAFSAAVAENKLDNALLADSYNRIGDCHYYSLDFQKAERFYDKALSFNGGDNDYALYQKAMMRGLQRAEQEKINLMDRVVSTYPTSPFAPKAIYEKAQAYESMGKNAQAIETFKSLVASYPQSQEARQGQLQMALLLKNMGKNDEARAQYENLVAKYPSSDEAKVAVDDLKRIYAEEGRLAAFADFMRSVGSPYEIDENEMAALSFEAAENDYLDNGNTARLKTYLKQYPSGANAGQAAFYIAEAEEAKGNDDTALEFVDKALEIAPDAPYSESALGLQGDLLLRQDSFGKAKEAFLLLEKKATSPFFRQRAQVGIVRAAKGENDFATVKQYAGLLLDSGSLTADTRAEVLYARANAGIRERDAAAAVADYSELVDNNVETLFGSMAAVELGEYYYQSGEYGKAEKTVNKLVDSSTPHHYWMARGFILLSDVYRAQGDKFQAREYLESLKSNYPGKEAEIFEMIEQRLDALK